MKSIFKRKWRVSTRWTIYVNGNIWLIYPQTSSKQAIQIEILWNALYCIANTTFDRVKAFSSLPSTITGVWSKKKKMNIFFFKIFNTLAKWHILLFSSLTAHSSIMRGLRKIICYILYIRKGQCPGLNRHKTGHS